MLLGNEAISSSIFNRLIIFRASIHAEHHFLIIQFVNITNNNEMLICFFHSFLNKYNHGPLLEWESKITQKCFLEGLKWFWFYC